LVEMLVHEDSWPAETAARMLAERQSPETRELLVKMSRDSKSHVGRLRAYRLLASFGATADDALRALKDPLISIREQGLLLMENQFPNDPELLKQALQLWYDKPRVQFQLALTLSAVPKQPAVQETLINILASNSNDEWIRRAVLISVGSSATDFLEQWSGRFASLKSPLPAGGIAFLQELTNLIGAQQDAATVPRALKTILAFPNSRLRLAGFSGLCQGIQRRGKSAPVVLAEAMTQQPGLTPLLKEFFSASLTLATATAADPTERMESLSVLQFANWKVADESLLKLVATDESQELCVKGIEVLGSIDDPNVPEQLLASYSTRTPIVRRAIVRTLLTNPTRIRRLFQAIKENQVSPVELDPGQVRALTNHADPELKQEALQVLAAAVPADRKLVLEQYQAALKLAAQPERGRVVFEKNCAACHQIGKLGVVVGPDIADLRTKTPAQVLLDILSPNQAIDNNYVSYTVVTKDGRVETGFIATETASSITLKQPENKTQVILRQDIEELKSNGISLMPDGLEKNITIEQMADLISFVKNWRYLNGQVPIKVSQP
ncbi:MAG: hypothetical protein JWN70_4360, partial [Planctomycetaceae bacterium]|nr:hypothetical protein [Planctomycetaceae bacterium]